MTTVTNAFLELAYDAERDGFPQAAASFRKLAHGTTDIPGDDWSTADAIRAIEIVRDLAAYQQGADDALAAIEQRLTERKQAPVAPHPLEAALRAYSAAGTPEHYAALATAWEAAGLPVKDEDEDGRVVFTDTSRPITVERIEMGRDRSWLDFTIGDAIPHRMLVGVDIVGGRPGCELLIWGNSIHEDGQTITLEQLRQIHADLGAMLADARLLAALG